MKFKSAILRTLVSRRGALPLWAVLLRAITITLIVAAFLIALVYGINALKGII